jgi:hypothetical protein
MTRHLSQAAMAHACEPIETRIRRFPRKFQRRLRKLVKGSKPLKDLLYAFPGAVFVLAARNRPPEARAEGVRLAQAGRPLADVAAALGLPMWLRRLPPEAFAAPFGRLPDADGFGRRVANLTPSAPKTAAMWLQWLAFSAEQSACRNLQHLPYRRPPCRADIVQPECSAE